MSEGKKAFDKFSNAELKEIHKALHDNRRKYVEIKDEKHEIFEHNKLKQVRYNSTIFSKFVDNQIDNDIKATYVIKTGAPIYYWNVINDDNIYKNKFQFRSALKRLNNA